MSSKGTKDSAGSGAERRRYVRQAIRLDALISIQGRQPIPCVVRDFCVAGIFVALTPEHLHGLSSQTGGTLYFSLIVEGQQRDCQLALTIFRIVGNGIGCGFNAPDPSTINLLQALADASSPQVPDSPEEFRQTQSGFRPKFLQIKDELGDLCVDKVGALVQNFLRVADDGLFLGARDAGNNLDETRFLDGQREFKSRKDALENDVPALVRKGVEILNSPVVVEGSSESEVEEDSGSELSLVDKDDFEEFLKISELISELEPKFKSSLFDLERRFSYLANRELDEHNNPLGPEVICNIFAEALKSLESDRIAITNIYNSLRKVLDTGLQRCYDDVNKYLIEQDVLPVIDKTKPVIKRKPSRKPPAKPGGEEAANVTDTQELQADPGVGYDNLAATQYGQQAPGVGSAGHAAPVSVAPAAPLPPLQPGLVPPGANPPPGQVSVGVQPGQIQPGQIQPGQIQPGQIQPGQIQPGQIQPGQIQPGQIQPGQIQPGQIQPGQIQPGQIQPGQIQPGQIEAGQIQAGGRGFPMPFDATFGGFVGGPAVYAAPSMQQAYSTAQTQLALRRQLAVGAGSEAATVDLAGPSYQTRQIVDGLTSVQQSMGSSPDPTTLGVKSIKERIVESIRSAGGGEGHIGQTESDAIEVIANLFQALIDDAYLTEGAKSNLARLQAPVHKVALMDTQFFEATNHPVRQVLNRVALVDDAVDDEGIARNEKITKLIEQVNQEFTDDIGVFDPLVGELDDILRDQRQRYQENVSGVVESSIEQQKIMEERRDKNLSATDTSGAKKELPAEWNKWLDRVRALAVGDRLVMNANTAKPFTVTLVWIGEDNEPFVLVDQKGHKVSTLTMQQVAMYLRRGTLKLLDPDSAGAVDRALFDMVNRMHGDVESQATKDELTEFLNRKSFLQNIERNLPEGAKKDHGAVLCQVSIAGLKDTNDRFGIETGDMVLASIAGVLSEKLARKNVSLGRLSGADLGVYWPKGGIASAQKKLQTCFDAIEEIKIEKDDETITPNVAAGLVSIEDSLAAPEELLEVAGSACATAKTTPAKPIHIAGSENKYKEKLEQMVAYVAKAIDRERLVFLVQKIERLGDQVEIPAAHVVVSAEDRNGKIIPPSLFSQALDKSERGFEVDTWIMKKALSWIAENENILEDYSAVVIPLSSAAVQRDDLSNVIITQLMETAVPPGRIAFEIADKDVVHNLTEVSDTMRTLAEFGCRFILDEFGSGQENYDYLKELAADFVTIQTAYIRDASNNDKDFAMAKSINELAHFMGKRTIAKRERGMENEDMLAELGIDFMFDQSRSSRVELAQ